ncbi:response regulator transcription factor [Rhizobium ruizarguesonis]
MYILVVEDQQDIIEMLRLTWSDSRDKLEYISSVAQARRYIESNETSAYDCMIIDINLPDGSGLELLREARLRSEIPVVMISGAGDADSRADAISVGADDYLMKPFSVKELRARTPSLCDASERTVGATCDVIFRRSRRLRSSATFARTFRHDGLAYRARSENPPSAA